MTIQYLTRLFAGRLGSSRCRNTKFSLFCLGISCEWPETHIRKELLHHDPCHSSVNMLSFSGSSSTISKALLVLLFASSLKLSPSPLFPSSCCTLWSESCFCIRGMSSHIHLSTRGYTRSKKYVYIDLGLLLCPLCTPQDR
jgi:hypothetical protein